MKNKTSSSHLFFSHPDNNNPHCVLLLCGSHIVSIWINKYIIIPETKTSLPTTRPALNVLTDNSGSDSSVAALSLIISFNYTKNNMNCTLWVKNWEKNHQQLDNEE